MATKKHVNPQNLKVGDKILVLESKNGAANLKNTVVTVSKERVSNFIVVQTIKGVARNLYYSSPADKFMLISREKQADMIEEQVKILEEEIVELKKEAEFLRKYKTEEEFVAAKLDAIMTAHEKGETKASRIKKMAAVLKEMKDSNIL